MQLETIDYSGPPVAHRPSRLWRAGQLVMDADGVVWRCSRRGRPGDWEQVSGGGGGVVGWVEIPISTDESDWDNGAGAWVFNGDGTISSTNTEGAAFMALPSALGALVGFIIQVSGSLDESVTGVPPFVDGVLGVVADNDPAEAQPSVGVGLYNDASDGPVHNGVEGRPQANDIRLDSLPGTSVLITCQAYAQAYSLWADGVVVSSAASAGAVDAFYPSGGCFFVARNAGGNEGVTFDLNTLRVFVPALPALP